MIPRSTLRNGLNVGFATAFIVVIGMPAVFAERYIIADVLSFSATMLVAIFLGAGFFAVRHSAADSGQVKLALNGAVAAAVTALVAIIALVLCIQINASAISIGMIAVFPNVSGALVSQLTFGQESATAGYLMLLATAAIIGALGGLAILLPKRILNIGAVTLLMVVVLGLLQAQINTIITLVDALWVTGAVAIGYIIATWRARPRLAARVGEAAVAGALLGLLIGILLLLLGATSETMPALLGKHPPALLQSFVLGKSTLAMLLLLTGVSLALSAIGATLSATTGSIHRLGITVLLSLLLLGILNVFGKLDLPAAILITAVMIAGQLLLERTTRRSEAVFTQFRPAEQQNSQRLVSLAGLALALILPMFLTGYINNVVDLIGLYIMMGLGLNIVVGFAGLLNLGYVAFFTIGAYTVGVLTTPNAITCGGVPAAGIATQDIATLCTGITTFWVAWPAAVLMAGLTGMLLGIPVLRLRGDYLAIVTLGFGEIIRLLALSDVFKAYLGGAQGIVNIPSPVIDLTTLSEPLVNSGVPILAQLGTAISQPIALSGPGQIYYLILFGVVVATFVTYRLGKSRLGRAWRSMREDEAVSQAMGVNLVQNKLLAFTIGAAFAGIGGGIFGSYLKSIFPNSFTLLVSINVLAVVIIGGMGNIPGIFVGAVVIFGLPEALREFQEYRLLMFGGLLVLTMLLRPQGLLPPRPVRLEEKAKAALAKKGT